MAKLELFQAVLNKMLSDIRDDAIDSFSKPHLKVVVGNLGPVIRFATLVHLF